MSSLAPAVSDFPVIDDDPFSLEFLNDPFPAHERMRAAGDAFSIPKYGIYGMARFAPVYEAMRDWRRYASGPGVGIYDLRKAPNPVLKRKLTLEIDPPEHGRYRQFLSKTLAPVNLKKMMEEANLEADRLAGRLLDQGVIDVVRDIAEAFVLKVFCDAIGFRTEYRELFLQFSHGVFNSMGPEGPLREETDAIGTGLYNWVISRCQRDALEPGGIGRLIYDAADRGEIDPKDVELLIRPLTSAGIDTTVASIATAVHGLAEHPEQWELLKADPGLAAAAFEEGIRWTSPIQTFFRTTTCAVEVGGGVIPADSKVMMSIGAANRDPQRWENPEEFRIDRPQLPHMGFGSGIHTCVGQPVARFEGVAILSALARRIGRFEPVGKPVYKMNNSMRVLKTCPVRVHPA